MAGMRSYRVVKSGVSRTLLAEELSEIGLTRRTIHEPDDGGYYEEVWANADATVAINYVEDSFSGQRYVSIREFSDGDVLEEFTRRLATYGPGELIEQAYRDLPREEMVDVLFRIAITFEEFDPEAATVLAGTALDDGDPNVRCAAIQAIGMRAWPEMRPIIDQISGEAASGVQDLAAQVLARWPT